MKASKIDGRIFAENLRKKVRQAVTQLPNSPSLAVVLVGEDPASQVYVASKVKFTEECGMNSLEYKLPADTKETEVVNLVKKLNENDKVDGILVQLPLQELLLTQEIQVTE